ncbi:sensor histidine kinase [Allostreptomyces psammosilenae]|uniref:histidine kinase n=1 Tax=Allostreptomyces psammosilenae TaxID=1892865 RepID=A0A852ZZH1_9ACTN|nr:histidine kinase [Allostreptomyces psammosilenae]NYI07736.1 signal transduction histidine kinase [Allostreptomyces psammosilenae]
MSWLLTEASPVLRMGPVLRRWVVGALVALTAILLFSGSAMMAGPGEANSYGYSSGTALALATLQNVPLVLSLFRPAAALCLNLLSAVLIATTGHPSSPEMLLWPWLPQSILSLIAVCLMVAAFCRWREIVLLCLALAATIAYAESRAPGAHSNTLTALIFSALILGLGLLRAGRGAVRERIAQQEVLTQEERALRTLLEERARIARELHDVVAHHMSVVAVQADSAPYRLAGLTPEARGEFESIAGAARQALSEMRRMLGVLRSEESGGERAPQPGLGEVVDLVEGTRGAGVAVELHGEDPRALAAGGRVPETTQLTAYRVVQEALSNVVRHAPGAATRVRLEAADGRLRVLVENDAAPPARSGARAAAHPPAEPPSGRAGQGLVGMRERVAALAGELSAAPTADGGFRVLAVLPLGSGLPGGGAGGSGFSDGRRDVASRGATRGKEADRDDSRADR